MSEVPIIAVLKGGVSPEREVSLKSGDAAAKGLAKSFSVEIFDVDTQGLPSGLDCERHVAFSTLHGVFGEDGAIQKLLEEAGVVYAGCDATSSALTFDKANTKSVLRAAGLPVLDDQRFSKSQIPSAKSVVDQLGAKLVLKPNDQGSSVGLSFINSLEELEDALRALEFESWIIEPMVVGMEVSVGVVDGEAKEIVEIRPKSGKFDYESKYTKGLTEYIVPAPLKTELRKEIQEASSAAFEACGCRDFARVDLMIDGDSRPWILEINTLPGLTETSLLPMSAGACGWNYEKLLRKLVEPAITRFSKKYSIC